MHFYREGYGDKWAEPAPIGRYPNVQDLFSTFEAFLQHCNVTVEGPNHPAGSERSLGEITTPYLDRHNDVLQIYARRDNGGFVPFTIWKHPAANWIPKSARTCCG